MDRSWGMWLEEKILKNEGCEEVMYLIVFSFSNMTGPCCESVSNGTSY